MKKYIFIVFIFLYYTKIYAQQSDSIARKKFPHFTSYTEVGGSALFYSQNIEFFISNNRTVNFNIRAGIGITDEDEVKAPFLINSIIGRKKSKLELGIGVSLPIGMTATIGYRHQADNGLFYRIAFTPLFNNYESPKILPWGGLSLGYYFGYRKTKIKEAPKPFVNLDSADKKLNLIIKTDIFVPFASLSSKTGYGSLTIEKGFKRKHSAQLTVVYTGYKKNNSYSDSTWYNHKSSGFQIIPEYKYFTGRQRYYTGFYSGVYAKYAYVKTESSGRNYHSPDIYNFSNTYNSMAAGIIIGYQNYIIKRRVVIDILVGGGYGYEYVNYSSHYYEFIDVRLAVNIGYRF